MADNIDFKGCSPVKRRHPFEMNEYTKNQAAF